MAGFENFQSLLHWIWIRLYPNYLTDNVKYITRYATECPVSMSANTAMNVAFCVCDAWSANMKYYSISPHVGGLWDSADEVHDRKKHSIGFTFLAFKSLRELASPIRVEVESVEEFAAFDTVKDASTGAINEALTIGSEMNVSNHCIKIEGNTLSFGLYLMRESDGTTHKITRWLAVNSGTKLITIVPALTLGDRVRVRVVTRYSGSKILLKEARSFESAAILLRRLFHERCVRKKY